MRSQGHDRNVHSCYSSCKRSFHNESNLRHHLNSKLHRPTTCAVPVTAATCSLSLHLELGTCLLCMAREQLDCLFVRAYTNEPRATPHWASGSVRATERLWNRVAYESFLCDATFGTFTQLNRHLQSPHHGDKIYNCLESDYRSGRTELA